MYKYIYTYDYVYTYMYMFTLACIWRCDTAYFQPCIYSYIIIYIHCTHTYIYIHTYIATLIKTLLEYFNIKLLELASKRCLL